MSDIAHNVQLRAALRDLLAWASSTRTPLVLVGGVAASLRSEPRFTRDIDAIVHVPDEHWRGFIAAGGAYGFQPRRPDWAPFAQRTRMLLLHHEPTGIPVDLMAAASPVELGILERGELRAAGELTLPLARAEDLILMKLIAHRDRDLIDIERLIELNPDLDTRALKRRVREVAAVLDAPDPYEELERLLKRFKRRRRS